MANVQIVIGIEQLNQPNAKREKRNAYMLLVGKPEGERLLGRPNRRWVDDIKMGLVEIGWDGVDCICLAREKDKWTSGELL
jgi:hypothetical protein